MSFVIVPDPVTAKLTAAVGPTPLVAADGRVLGYFTPSEDKDERYILDPGISDEELERRFAEGGGRPLADILRDLEARG